MILQTGHSTRVQRRDSDGSVESLPSGPLICCWILKLLFCFSGRLSLVFFSTCRVSFSSLPTLSSFSSGLKFTIRYTSFRPCMSSLISWCVLGNVLVIVAAMPMLVCLISCPVQARGLATDNLRPFFFTANGLVYCIQVWCGEVASWCVWGPLRWGLEQHE